MRARSSRPFCSYEGRPGKPVVISRRVQVHGPGRWDFFDEEKFQGPKVELGPGVYLHVKDHGMKDNSISSIRLVKPMGR